MNRRPPGLLLSTCIDGFLQYKVAEGLSPNTLYCNRRMLRQWLGYIGDIKISEVGSQDISAYLAWLRTEYTPSRWNGDTSPLSAKTIRNVWVALSSFYSWAEEEFELAHPMRKVPAPRFQKAVVDPFTKEDIEKLLKACKYCRTAYPRDRSRFTFQIDTGWIKRNGQSVVLAQAVGVDRSLLLLLVKADLVATKDAARIRFRERPVGRPLPELVGVILRGDVEEVKAHQKPNPLSFRLTQRPRPMTR